MSFFNKSKPSGDTLNDGHSTSLSLVDSRAGEKSGKYIPFAGKRGRSSGGVKNVFDGTGNAHKKPQSANAVNKTNRDGKSTDKKTK